MNHITRSHKVFRTFIDLSPKAANQVFIQITHFTVMHHVRMQVNAGKVLANLEQHTGFVESNNGIGKIELFKDNAGIIRKMGDIVLKVLARLGASKIANLVF